MKTNGAVDESEVEKINGIDPATYNRELLLALLSVISNTPQDLFDTIDLTYFSSYSLGDKSWTAVGDCYMMNAEYVWEDYLSKRILNQVGFGDTSLTFLEYGMYGNLRSLV